MSKKKKTKHKPIPFGDIDVCRKSIEWHLQEASELHEQLAPHKTGRGFIGATNHKGNEVCIIFAGNVDDIFKVKEFLEREDAKQS